MNMPSVRGWLGLMGLGEYAESFEEQRIDFAIHLNGGTACNVDYTANGLPHSLRRLVLFGFDLGQIGHPLQHRLSALLPLACGPLAAAKRGRLRSANSWLPLGLSAGTSTPRS